MQPFACTPLALTNRAFTHCKPLKAVLFFILFSGFINLSPNCFGQSIGDYRSAASGDWKDITTWERFNGLIWTTPSSSFPNVASSATSAKTATTGSTHTITLPSGITIGDLLIIFWSDANDVGTAPTTPLGWTQLTTQTSGSRNRVVWYKIATGVEGASVDITAGEERSAHVALRIEAGSFFGNPVGAVANGTGRRPNPPNLNSGFGVTNTLWIASGQSVGDDNSISPLAPTDYTNLVTAYTGSSGNSHARVAVAQRELEIDEEDPTRFTLGSGANWAANTIAIRGPLIPGEGVPTSASGEITILNGHTVTVASPQTADQLIIESGGQITVNSGHTLAVSDGTGTDINVNGTLSVTGTFTNAGTAVFGSGSTYVHNLNGGTVPIATWDANSTCQITGITSSNPNNTTQNFGHFTWNCPGHTGNRRFAGNFAFVIQGDLTITDTGSGELRFRNNKANIIGGNFIQSGGILVDRLDGSNSLTINGNFELSGGTLRNDGDDTPGGVLNVAGNFSHTGGTIDGGSLLNVFFNGTNQDFTKSGMASITGIVNFNVNSGSNVNIGTSQMTGNAFTLSAGSTLQTTINSLASFGQVSLTGAATTNGTITANFGSFVPTMGDMFNIVSGASGYSGTPTLTSTSNTHNIDVTYLGGVLSIGTLILPIELLSFRGKAIGKTVELSWETLSELNNDFMAVERSNDSTRFLELGKVPGAGTTQQTQQYAFVDEQPLTGINYYRLKQVDYDGQYEYSKVISVKTERIDASITLFPNPAGETVTVSIATNQVRNAKLKIYDLSGRLLKTEAISLTGELFQHEIDLSFLPSGMFIVEISAGDKKWQEKLVVE